MRVKLKYVLPLVQMLVALALLLWTEHQDRVLMRTQDMPGTPPSFSLLVTLNASIGLLRMWMFRYLPGWWDDISLIAMIGLLWYWVALNIDSWRTRRAVYTFSSTPVRLATDIILVDLGGILGIILFEAVRPYFSSVYYYGAVWWVPCFGLFLAWSVTLILFFGRDFFLCVRAKIR